MSNKVGDDIKNWYEIRMINQIYVIPNFITHITAHNPDLPPNLVSQILPPYTSKLEFRALNTGFQLEKKEGHLQRDILFYLDDFSPTITLKQHLKAPFLIDLSKYIGFLTCQLKQR